MKHLGILGLLVMGFATSALASTYLCNLNEIDYDTHSGALLSVFSAKGEIVANVKDDQILLKNGQTEISGKMNSLGSVEIDNMAPFSKLPASASRVTANFDKALVSGKMTGKFKIQAATSSAEPIVETYDCSKVSE